MWLYKELCLRKVVQNQEAQIDQVVTSLPLKYHYFGRFGYYDLTHASIVVVVCDKKQTWAKKGVITWWTDTRTGRQMLQR